MSKSWLELIDNDDWHKLSDRDRTFLCSLQKEFMDERYFKEVKM